MKLTMAIIQTCFSPHRGGVQIFLHPKDICDAPVVFQFSDT